MNLNLELLAHLAATYWTLVVLAVLVTLAIWSAGRGPTCPRCGERMHEGDTYRWCTPCGYHERIHEAD